jgi:hypothetical protein
VDAALQRAAGRADRFEAGEERVEIAGSRYIDWLIPGLLGMNIMGTGMWGIGFAIVHARSRRASNGSRRRRDVARGFLLAQMLARLVSSDSGGALPFAWLMFQVLLKGSLATSWA